MKNLYAQETAQKEKGRNQTKKQTLKQVQERKPRKVRRNSRKSEKVKYHQAFNDLLELLSNQPLKRAENCANIAKNKIHSAFYRTSLKLTQNKFLALIYDRANRLGSRLAHLTSASTGDNRESQMDRNI